MRPHGVAAGAKGRGVVDNVWPALQTLVPSVGLLALFYFVLRHMLEGDRRERMAQAQWEREHDLARGAVAPGKAEAVRQNAYLPMAEPGTMDTRKPESESTP